MLSGLTFTTQSLSKIPQKIYGDCTVNRQRAEKLRDLAGSAESTLESLLLFRDVSFESWAKLNCDFKKD